MKRMTALLLSLMVALSLFPVGAAAEETAEEEFAELIASDSAFLGVGDLKYYEDEPNNVEDEANVIDNGYTVLGVADGSDYDLDIYRFDLSQKSKVQAIAMSSSSMLIFSLEGNGVDLYAEELGKVNGSRYYTYLIECTLAPGTYYINMIDVNACMAGRRVAYDIYLEWKTIESVPMFRMYDPNSGEHFYTGAEAERDFLVEAGWQYEGVGFNFPEEGDPVHRLYEPVHGEHLYTMDEAEMDKLLDQGWEYEGVAFNSAGTDEVPQYRLHNPNEKRGAYHFTGSEVERDILIEAGWEYQGIGWYSCMD